MRWLGVKWGLEPYGSSPDSRVQVQTGSEGVELGGRILKSYFGVDLTVFTVGPSISVLISNTDPQRKEFGPKRSKGILSRVLVF